MSQAMVVALECLWS